MREIIAYGKTKGVGVWLYLNDVGGRQFPLEANAQTIRRMGRGGREIRLHEGQPRGEERSARG